MLSLPLPLFILAYKSLSDRLDEMYLSAVRIGFLVSSIARGKNGERWLVMQFWCPRGMDTALSRLFRSSYTYFSFTWHRPRNRPSRFDPSSRNSKIFATTTCARFALDSYKSSRLNFSMAIFLPRPISPPPFVILLPARFEYIIVIHDEKERKKERGKMIMFPHPVKNFIS